MLTALTMLTMLTAAESNVTVRVYSLSFVDLEGG